MSTTAMKTGAHIIEALRWAADQTCKRDCGTVCLCGPCHARVALSRLMPGFHPKKRKRNQR
jgi:hypothetical protein